MTKKGILLLTSVLLFGCAHKTALRFTRPVPTDDVKLVFDKEATGSSPFRFRRNSDLKASASGTFSQAGAKMIAHLSGVVVVFDLRQESHGLVNALPVTWSSEHDWANADLRHDEAIEREMRYLSEIHIGGKLQGKKVRSVETEESLIRSLNQPYQRITVNEGLRPRDEEVDRFLEAVRNLPHGAWVHFHDRDGRGRSTLFLTMYDMIRNAGTLSYDELVRRNAELSNDRHLMDLAGLTDAQRPYREDEIDFLKRFYDYAKDPRADQMSWSEWVKK